jgi:hypothetical protein
MTLGSLSVPRRPPPPPRPSAAGRGTPPRRSPPRPAVELAPAVAAVVEVGAVVAVARRNHLEGAWRRLSSGGEAFSTGGWRI